MTRITYKTIVLFLLYFTAYSSFSQTDVKQLKKDLTSVTDIETAKQFRKDRKSQLWRYFIKNYIPEKCY